MSKDQLRLVLKNTIDDTVSRLLYYDRKEDDELPVGKIEEMVDEGTVTVDEIVGWISEQIRQAFTKAGKP